MNKIHLNCDLGEGGKHDKDLMSLISACNIACGGHAGTLESMHHTVDMAIKYGVEIGAHPSYPDKENFGRVSKRMDPEKLRRSLIAQILSLKQIAEAEGTQLSHVKPHGALYHDAQTDATTAGVLLDAIREFDKPLTLFVREGSLLAEMAEGLVRTRYEAFADRNYHSDGSLVARSKQNAVITEKNQLLDHLLRMVEKKEITCVNGERITTNATTYCFHSDTPKAPELVKYLHDGLSDHQIQIERVS